MGSKGGRKPPLVADRRYSAGAAQAKAAAKPAAAKRKAAPRRAVPARHRSWPVRIVLGLVVALWRLFWGIGWRVGLAAGLVLLVISGFFYAQLPSLDALVDARTKGSVTLLDRDGKVFAWRGETFGGTITADTVSPYLKNAVVATEDKRFYRHLGISPRGIASAVRINLSEGRGPLSGNGGSTITQQVAKAAVPGRAL